MVSLFRRVSVLSWGMLFAACVTQVCAGPGENPGLLPDNRWSYDEVTANVPRKQAAIAAVALAKINIALYRARQLAEQRLCAGKWTPRGTVQQQQGPVVMNRELHDRETAKSVWFFQSLRDPQTLTCPDVTRAEYFMEMSRHLPAWISVRPAGQVTQFRLGQVFAGNQHSVAAR